MVTNKCCCCEQTTVERWDICEKCNWQNDPIQNEDPTYEGGANIQCLNEYKKQYLLCDDKTI